MRSKLLNLRCIQEYIGRSVSNLTVLLLIHISNELSC